VNSEKSIQETEFFANMSHELRTPMNAILGFAEMVHDQAFGALNERQNRYMNNIITSGQHLLNLIKYVLDLAKVEAGRVELEIADVNLTNMIMISIDYTRSLANQKELVLTMELADPLPVVRGDLARLNQILVNLLSNAIKFTPEKGRVNVIANAQNEHVIISVIDTGIGLRSEDQERVFEKFEQVESNYGRTQEGTGLGLALTRQLVELHGGRIWVESQGEGTGSTFSVELPV
jgi:signal transduction histidine kinase